AAASDEVFDIEQVGATNIVGTGTTESCTDAALDTALAAGGLVTFNCGGPATIDISKGTGTKTIAADTMIDGGGQITISGGDTIAVFLVNPGATFTLSNLTIAHAEGIANNGTLNVTNCSFNNNKTASAIGSAGSLTVIGSVFTSNQSGAIYCDKGTALVANTTFAGNHSGSGGAVYNFSAAVTVAGSTFVNNHAVGTAFVPGFGGAIFNDIGSTSVTNSTFKGNVADANGGGGAITSGGCCSGGGAVTVTNCTFTGNLGGMGGGVHNNRGSIVLRNSIVASVPASSCAGVVTDGGSNLDDGTSCAFSSANASLSNTDPQLDPAGLQLNGGPTKTVRLCAAAGTPAGCTAASPAIDAGDPSVCAGDAVNNVDQRGFPRPSIGHAQCSIGAYEADPSSQQMCVGDCSGMSIVAINDLITLVNIALGNTQLAACEHGVAAGVEVDVALIIHAVNNALNGCGPQ
ncbi:MAG: hypothetical protein HY270_21040, partial [Deltaproteobacteria bacterium]|nr:hypothetical protein [Deltaproteobacteria bacterium]